MNHPTAGVQTPRAHALLVRPVWGRTAPYLLAFALPLTTTAFLLSGERALAVAWLGTLAVFAWLDERLAPVPDEPLAAPSGRPFDAILYALALLQFVHLGLLVSRVARDGLSAVDSWIAIALVGAGSAYSALVVSHELIHRRQALPRYLGRALLWPLLYDQFFTEHLRGHHARVGTTEDALAVRPGESFARYLFRSWLAELRSAFSIETRRLGGHHAFARCSGAPWCTASWQRSGWRSR